MDLKEFDALLHDAEVSLKRLKALYEQWFQGIERLEPTVARKDLDRAFVILKREKPRNTAARFRLQQLYARYQVYTTYWGRIARQIEEGTFERDVRRAQRIRGGVERAKEAKAYELDLDQDVDLGDDLSELDEIASALSALDVAPAPQPAKKPGLGVFSPFAMAARGQAAKQPTPSEPSPAPSATTFKKPVTATFGKPEKPAASAATATPSAPRATSGSSAAQPVTAARADATKPAASSPAPHAARFGVPAGSPAPARVDAPKPASPSVPRPPATSAERPAIPRPPNAAAIPRPPSIARPEPPGASPPPAAAPPRPPAPRPGAREDDGLRRLYDSYVDARRRNNEAGDVAYDKLATSVRQMTSKLREKHGDRKIDFEIVVQNGKVGLKPKIGS